MTEIDDRDKPDPGKAAVTSRPARDSVRGSHDGGDGTGEIAVRDFPAGPEPGISRPSTAPAYYLGRPARLWITVMRPRRRRTTSDHPVQAVTGGGKQAHHGTAAGRKIRSPLIPARFFPAPTNPQSSTELKDLADELKDAHSPYAWWTLRFARSPET